MSALTVAKYFREKGQVRMRPIKAPVVEKANTLESSCSMNTEKQRVDAAGLQN